MSHFLQILYNPYFKISSAHKTVVKSLDFHLTYILLETLQTILVTVWTRINSPLRPWEVERHLEISYTLLPFQYTFLISWKWNRISSWIAQVLKFDNDAQYVPGSLLYCFEQKIISLRFFGVFLLFEISTFHSVPYYQCLDKNNNLAWHSLYLLDLSLYLACLNSALLKISAFSSCLLITVHFPLGRQSASELFSIHHWKLCNFSLCYNS